MVRYGIDLGTTYSAISCYDPNRKFVQVAQLNTADGGPILRSVVYYPANGKPVVGEAAMNALARFPDRVIIGIKRSMGDAWKTPPIDGKQYTPAEVSSEILKVLKADGEAFFGQPVEDVIITVPAYFGSDQRRDTAEAGRLAGLNVLRLLEEPSAAALAFAIDQVDMIAGRNILVYDLGGGTFDVTLIHCEREEYEPGAVGLKIRTICKDGNRKLGGLDWDSELRKIVGNRCMEKFQYDPRIDTADDAWLYEQCEKNKRHLSQLESVSIPADMRGHTVEVTLSEFQEKTAQHLHKTRLLLEKVLQMAENPDEELRGQFPEILPLRRDQIEMLLCGGATKMPAVEALIQEIMGRPPLKHGNPELLVAMGAAYAAYLSPHLGEEKPLITTYDKAGKPITVDAPPENIEIVVQPVGIEVLKDAEHPELGTKIDPVIPGGANVGVIHKGHYAAAFDGAMAVEIVLWEGDDPDPANCIRLDSFMMHTNKPGRPKGWGITVELKYDDSGKIVGKAMDDETKEEMQISYERRRS
ncbi:MAG: Hsp70 family protein [Proteobacteria bacterium]|nr:Hsp70 family protein [Pseudomonadota bacterium]